MNNTKTLNFGSRRVPYCFRDRDREVLALEENNSRTDAIQDVKTADVQFLGTLQVSDEKATCLVNVWGKKCIMKIHAHTYDRHGDNVDRQNLNFFREAATCRYLKQHGFCERGLVPDFYGVVRDMMPEDWSIIGLFRPRLLPADAILIEFIPEMQMLNLENYTKSRGEIICQTFRDFNRLGVLHRDIHPRNIQIVIGRTRRSERVLWTDFELSELIDRRRSKGVLKEWLKNERKQLAELLKCVAEDYEIGELDSSYHYYHESSEGFSDISSEESSKARLGH